MSKLKFNDGVTIDTSGTELKVIKLHDGYYVTGRGCCLPVKDLHDGLDLITKMTANK
jgi:hypothetical protein